MHNALKLVAISDTHGQHNKLKLPEGDILIHAGDMSMRGTDSEIENFLSWFREQRFKYKICIAGNHDFFFERSSEAEIEKLIPEEITYLKDSGIVIKGLKIWGSPVTPWFMNWAFNRHRGYEIARHWDLIPQDTDILVTHGPMFGLLDENNEGQHVGCKDLYLKMEELKLKSHIFGHIHESYGILEKQNVKFLNASTVNARYELTNEPLLIEV
jgi:Icc-related predicted phosphoesterase